MMRSVAPGDSKQSRDSGGGIYDASSVDTARSDYQLLMPTVDTVRTDYPTSISDH